VASKPIKTGACKTPPAVVAARQNHAGSSPYATADALQPVARSTPHGLASPRQAPRK